MNYELLLPRGDQNPLKLTTTVLYNESEHQKLYPFAFLVGQKGPNKKVRGRIQLVQLCAGLRGKKG
jgi:hypothetical protein